MFCCYLNKYSTMLFEAFTFGNADDYTFCDSILFFTINQKAIFNDFFCRF